MCRHSGLSPAQGPDKHGRGWFCQCEFLVLLSPITTSLSDPTEDPASASLYGSLRLKPAQTCPGLAPGPARPSRSEGGRERRWPCCRRGTLGGF